MELVKKGGGDGMCGGELGLGGRWDWEGRGSSATRALSHARLGVDWRGVS